MLDLVYDKFARFYQAPLQVKANGGMFLIDDFGRQQVRPAAAQPLDRAAGEARTTSSRCHRQKFQVPFDQLIIFSTNLEPKDLVDEAFLRRIPYKIHVTNPSVETFREIFRRQCEALKVPFEQNGLVYLCASTM